MGHIFERQKAEIRQFQEIQLLRVFLRTNYEQLKIGQLKATHNVKQPNIKNSVTKEDNKIRLVAEDQQKNNFTRVHLPKQGILISDDTERLVNNFCNEQKMNNVTKVKNSKIEPHLRSRKLNFCIREQ